MATMTTALAETVTFDITYPTDPISKKVLKNTDGDNYFYVTPHYFSTNGTLHCVSYRLDNSNVRSNTLDITQSDLYKTRSAKYQTTAAGGVYYYMRTAASVNGLNVSGRYTP